MNLKKNITGIPMLMALQFIKPYIASGKVKISEQLKFDEIIQSNENIGGNLHMLIAMLLENITNSEACQMQITLSSKDIIAIQSLTNPNQMVMLEQLPTCKVSLEITFTEENTAKVYAAINSPDETILPNVSISFGFTPGEIGTWIDMIHRENIELLVRKFLIKKTTDAWRPKEDLSNFNSLEEAEQRKIAESVEKQYVAFFEETTKKFENFCIDGMLENFKQAITNFMSSIENMKLSHFIVDINIDINQQLDVVIDYYKKQ